jgi:glutathione S-transferase
MTIVFYDYAPAPSPRRARMVLAEKGIAHEAREVDMTKGEQLSPDYRKINASGTIPTVVLEDGTLLTENWGIACWAEAHQPEPNLMGITAAEKGIIASWASKLDFGFTLAFAEAYRNSHKGMAGRALPGPRNFDQIPELAERGFVRLKDFLGYLDRQLDGHDYIACNRFTLADIWALTTIDVTRWIKAGPTEEHANINRWHETVSARQSAKL